MEGKLVASSSQPNMIPPSSNFQPKLSDQDYMELVCENGQILAKSRRHKNNSYFEDQHVRKQSLFDLYVTEYDEGFKKNVKYLGDTRVFPVSESDQRHQDEYTVDEQPTNINNKTKTKSTNKRLESSTLIDDFARGSKNVQVIPDEQSVAVERSIKELNFASSSSMFSQETSSDLSGCSLKRKYGDIEEESSYLSNSSDDELDDAKTHVHARPRKRSTQVHTLSERKQRDKMNKKLRDLQDLLTPDYNYKDDVTSLLDAAIQYIKTLQLQIQMMSYIRSHYELIGGTQPTMLPMDPRMHMTATIPGINSCLNDPLVGLNPNSSSIFAPSVVPSCVPDQTHHSYLSTQFSKSVLTSNLEDAMQFRGSNGYLSRLTKDF